MLTRVVLYNPNAGSAWRTGRMRRVLERSSLGQLVPFWLHMMLPGGTPLRVPGVRVLAMRRLIISAAGAAPVEVHVNGDPVAHTPLAIEPSDTVRVLVPG